MPDQRFEVCRIARGTLRMTTRQVQESNAVYVESGRDPPAGFGRAQRDVLGPYQLRPRNIEQSIAQYVGVQEDLTGAPFERPGDQPIPS